MTTDQIFAKRHAGTTGYHDAVFHDDEHLLRTLTKVLDDPSASHRKLDPTEGLQDAQLDNGSRLHIVHADIGRDGHILVNIRKFSGIQIRRLDELVDRDMLDPPVARFVQAAIPGPTLHRLRRPARLRHDHAAHLLRRRARAQPPGRRGRGSLSELTSRSVT